MRRYDLAVTFYSDRAEVKTLLMNVLCNLSMIDHVANVKLIGEREVAFKNGKEFVLLRSVRNSVLEGQK